MGLWTHEWRPICFTLVVDDFGVKYVVGEEHAHHLLDVVKQYNKVTDDLGTNNQGIKFIDITLKWDYDKRRVHLSMPGYVPEALVRFKKERPSNLQDQSRTKTSSKYGQTQQFVKDALESIPATVEEKLTFSKSLEYFCILHGRWAQPCCWRSAP